MPRTVIAPILGILTFLGGIALLLLTFRLAYDLYQQPVGNVLGTQGENVIPANAANALAGVLIRIVLLFTMGAMGSWIANRGVNMLTAQPVRRRERDRRRASDAVSESGDDAENPE
ncbi:MAG: hypothetical protein SFX74_09700 [Fimbriimonadaceae bacterium]|nr:hypothetical protein [Fimbriimonadaceae bacterium]